METDLFVARNAPFAVRALAALPVTLLLAGLLLAPLSGHAHSELRATTPANGARLAQSPASLQLTFNEDVQVTALRLLDASGKPVRVTRAAQRDPRRSEAAGVPVLPPGAYRVLWAAISADGHPISGSFRFEVTGEARAGGVPATTNKGDATR